MSIVHDEQMPKFYRSLKTACDPLDKGNVAEALRTLASRIDKMAPYHSEGIWFEDYTTEVNGRGAVTFLYWYISKEQQRVQTYLEHEYDARSIECQDFTGPDIGLVQLRSYQGKGQHDVTKLLLEMATLITSKNIKQILDITLHNITDSDGLDRPILRLYYRTLL